MRYVLILSLLVACGTSKPVGGTVSSEENYKTLAESRYDGPIRYEFNPSQQRVLCIYESAKTVNQPRNTISFFVYDIRTEQELYTNSFDGGSVKWYDDDKLELLRIPGKMRNGQTIEDLTKVYDLITKESVSKSSITKSE